MSNPYICARCGASLKTAVCGYCGQIHGFKIPEPEPEPITVEDHVKEWLEDDEEVFTLPRDHGINISEIVGVLVVTLIGISMTGALSSAVVPTLANSTSLPGIPSESIQGYLTLMILLPMIVTARKVFDSV